MSSAAPVTAVRLDIVHEAARREELGERRQCPLLVHLKRKHTNEKRMSTKRRKDQTPAKEMRVLPQQQISHGWMSYYYAGCVNAFVE